MRLVTVGGVLAAMLLASGAQAVPRPEPRNPPPEITEQAIDQADLDGWAKRREEAAKADEAKAAKGKRAKRRPQKTEEETAEIAGPKGPVGDEPPDPFLIRLQIMLDRAHASPGVIDGHDGRNLRKAVAAFETMRGLPVDGAPDPEVWTALTEGQSKLTKVYEITPEDIKGRYVEKVPSDYGKLARLKWIGFRDAAEMLAERFHLDERLLKSLNPDVDFKTAGQRILVPETGAEPDTKVARIVVNKAEGELRAYGEDGKLVLIDRATVGSSDTPSPSGTMKVNGSFPNPHYIYDPKKNFRQGRNFRKLTLKPGPNGPVGSMWIDLSKPTYGIHGTPEPSKIDKTGSHGCVRLTNWDAEALGKIVEKNKTVVEFE